MSQFRRFAGRAGVQAKGFTLVEIIVVLAIMMILMGLGVYGFGAVRQMIRVKAARADLCKVKAAILKYKEMYTTWPGVYEEKEIEDPPGVKFKVRDYKKAEYIYRDLEAQGSRGSMLGRLEDEKIKDAGTDAKGVALKLYLDPWETPYYVRIYKDVVEIYSYGPDKKSDLGRCEGDRKLPKLEDLPAPAEAPYDDVGP